MNSLIYIDKYHQNNNNILIGFGLLKMCVCVHCLMILASLYYRLYESIRKKMQTKINEYK